MAKYFWSIYFAGNLMCETWIRSLDQLYLGWFSIQIISKNMDSGLTHWKSRHVDILLIQNYYVDKDGEEYNDDDVPTEPLRFHSVWIKSRSALVGAQVSKNWIKKFLCKRCLNDVWSEIKLASHAIDCIDMNSCRPKMPNVRDSEIEFKNLKHRENVHFIIYADTERILKPIEI